MIVNTTQTSIDISWSLPTENKFCVDHYRVCYKLASTFKGLQFAETCTITTDVAQTITNLEPCARYKIRVAAITAAGLYSIDALVEAHTQNAVPGVPTGYKVAGIIDNSITVGWNRPLTNPWCVKR